MKGSRSTTKMKLVSKSSYNSFFDMPPPELEEGGGVYSSRWGNCCSLFMPTQSPPYHCLKSVHLLPRLSLYTCRCVPYQAQASKLIYYYLMF